MASLSTTRRRRRKVDESVAKAFTGPIARVIRREETRVKNAKTQKQMLAAVREAEWVAVITTLWLSEPLRDVWNQQQTLLGTDLPMPPAVIKDLGRTAAEHGRHIADTRRDRIRRRFDG